MLLSQILQQLKSKKLQTLINSLSEYMQISNEHAANEIMATSSFAASTKVYAKHPYLGDDVSSSNFYITIAESGERKSSVQKLLMRDLYKRCHIYRQHNPKEKKNEEPAMLLNNSTEEGLVRALQLLGDNPVIGLWDGEGGAFFNSAGMTKENKNRMIMTLNKIWSGEPLSSTRVKHGGTLHIAPGAQVTMNFAVQLNVFEESVGTDSNLKNGFISRLLVVKSKSLRGTREFKDYVDMSFEHAELDDFIQNSADLLMDYYQSIYNSKELAIKKKEIALTSEAIDIYRAYCQYLEFEQIEGASFEHYGAFASKLPEHVLRLALTVAHIEESDKITGDIMEDAKTLGLMYSQYHKQLAYQEDRQQDAIEKYVEKAKRYLSRYREALHVSKDTLRVNPLRGLQKDLHNQVLEGLCEQKVIAEVKETVAIKGKNCRSAYKVLANDIGWEDELEDIGWEGADE